MGSVSQFHDFVVSIVTSIVKLLYSLAAWTLELFGAANNVAGVKLLTFFYVLVVLAIFFSLYRLPLSDAPFWIKLIFWPILVVLNVYTLVVFFISASGVLGA